MTSTGQPLTSKTKGKPGLAVMMRLLFRPNDSVSENGPPSCKRDFRNLHSISPFDQSIAILRQDRKAGKAEMTSCAGLEGLPERAISDRSAVDDYFKVARYVSA